MTVCIEVALRAEATPLIEAFTLKPLSGTHLFPIYESEGIKLIISGVGKIKAGAACGYIAGIHRDEAIFGWLNIGMGGHRSLKLGTPVLASKISDDARKAQYFPNLVFDAPCRTEQCITIENPEHSYPTKQVYDMEAAGFYAIASKIAPIEMVHVLKLISDNPSHPIKQVTKKEAHSHIYNNMPVIQTVITELQGLIDDMTHEKTPLLDEFIKRWHFSTFETLELKKLLQRWQLLCPDQILLSQDLLAKQTAEDVLTFLRKHIEALPLRV